LSLSKGSPFGTVFFQRKNFPSQDLFLFFSGWFSGKGFPPGPCGFPRGGLFFPGFPLGFMTLRSRGFLWRGMASPPPPRLKGNAFPPLPLYSFPPEGIQFSFFKGKEPFQVHPLLGLVFPSTGLQESKSFPGAPSFCSGLFFFSKMGHFSRGERFFLKSPPAVVSFFLKVFFLSPLFPRKTPPWELFFLLTHFSVIRRVFFYGRPFPLQRRESFPSTSNNSV